MKYIRQRLTWLGFFLLSWIVLTINGCRNKKIYLNFMQELKELCKKNSKYIEDSDYKLIHEDEIKCKKEL